AIAEAGSDATGIAQRTVGIRDRHQQRADRVGPHTVAGAPARHDALLRAGVAELQPVAAAPPFAIRRIGTLGHDALEPEFAARSERGLEIVARLRGHADEVVLAHETLEARTTLGVGQRGERAPALLEHIEHVVLDPDGLARALDIARVGESGTLLDAPEARHAALVGGHDLAVEHHVTAHGF